MIKPEDVLLVIFEGRGCNRYLLRWMRQFPRRWRTRPPNMLYDFLAVWRNQQIRQFLERTQLPWIWLIDDDMVPVPETMALLDTGADVAGCAYVSRTGDPAHSREGEVGAACLRISRRALTAAGPPWFAITASADGTSIEECECKYFSRRMREAGFQAVTIGRVGHVVPVVLVPGRQQQDPVEVRFIRKD